MVTKNKNFVFAAFKIVVPSFEGYNNSQKLTIVSFVLSFGHNYFSQKMDYWVPSAQIIQN